MPDRQLLTPERLEQLLSKLNEVMTEAARLRREVTRQLDDQQRTIQQKVTPARPHKAAPAGPRKAAPARARATRRR